MVVWKKRKILIDMRQDFVVGKLALDAMIHFGGYEIAQDFECSITVTIMKCLKLQKYIILSRTRLNKRTERATEPVF